MQEVPKYKSLKFGSPRQQRRVQKLVFFPYSHVFDIFLSPIIGSTESILENGRIFGWKKLEG